MMEQTKIYQALKGVRGREPVDLAALEQLLVRFSQLVVEQPWIKEIDINPLLASPDTSRARRPRRAARPGDTGSRAPASGDPPLPDPVRRHWTTKQGINVTIRPIRPEDEPLIAKFHETLSERTVFMRYLQAMNLSQRIAHERLSRLTSSTTTARSRCWCSIKTRRRTSQKSWALGVWHGNRAPTKPNSG